MPDGANGPLPESIRRLSQGARERWAALFTSHYGRSSQLTSMSEAAAQEAASQFATATILAAESPLDLEKPDFQLFVETEAFAAITDFSQPSWIPFLPKPGNYTHPSYGDVNISRQDNAEFVESVKSHVYQEHIPLDVEHSTKMSGAVAWVKDMRLNEDGTGDALVEWTPRGQQLMSSGGFRYVSPEWYRSWQDPATGEERHNVIVGGAITTRPFFKDGAMRALMMSERGAEVVTSSTYKQSEPSEQFGGSGMKTCADCGKDYAGTECACKTQKSTEPSGANLASRQDHVHTQMYSAAEVDAKIQQLSETFNTQLATERTARETAEGNLKLLQVERRNERFTEMAAGRGGATDGQVWAGDLSKHVSILAKLSDTFGEDSQEVKDYVEQQTAIATQVAEAGLFTEKGRSALPSAGSSEQKLQKLAETYAEQHKVTLAEGYDAVLKTTEGAQLFAEGSR